MSPEFPFFVSIDIGMDFSSIEMIDDIFLNNFANVNFHAEMKTDIHIRKKCSITGYILILNFKSKMIQSCSCLIFFVHQKLSDCPFQTYMDSDFY